MTEEQRILDRMRDATECQQRVADKIIRELVPEILSGRSDWSSSRRQLRREIGRYLEATHRLACEAFAADFRRIAVSGQWWKTLELAGDVIAAYASMVALWLSAATFMPRMKYPVTLIARFAITIEGS